MMHARVFPARRIESASARPSIDIGTGNNIEPGARSAASNGLSPAQDPPDNPFEHCLHLPQSLTAHRRTPSPLRIAAASLTVCANHHNHTQNNNHPKTPTELGLILTALDDDEATPSHRTARLYPAPAMPQAPPVHHLSSSTSASGSGASSAGGVGGAAGSNGAPLHSPCLLHSGLEKGASELADFDRRLPGAPTPALSKSLVGPDNAVLGDTAGELEGEGELVFEDSDDEEEQARRRQCLTRQLAETAVGVREMSKQLGRARVKSNIQTVMIITKARDNRLIKLTRELAIWCMMTPRENLKGRGLTVYVDSQLRNSKRFDAEGLKRDYPHLFEPRPRSHSHSASAAGSSTDLRGMEQLSMSMTSTSSVLSSSTAGDGPRRKGTALPGEEGQLRYWTPEMCTRSPHLFDIVVTLGGDGTVLFTSWLFQHIVPPVLPFALGSLGFLTNFDFSDYPQVINSAINDGVRVNLRMRFTCTIYRAISPDEASVCATERRRAIRRGETGEILMRNIERGGWESVEGNSAPGLPPGGKKRDKEIMCFSTRPAETFEVLNDLVVDRGPSPYVSQLELFGDEHHMTTVQADGLTVATPTGSTAYSLSAGGSLVHPEIPAILITPICPHTLSFRPMLLPDSMELRVCVPYNSRSTAWASFDGRGRVELKQGDHIKVTASKYPFPTVCADKQSTDWFHSLSRTLHWNERARQKSFVVVEEGRQQPGSGGRGKEGSSRARSESRSRSARVASRSRERERSKTRAPEIMDTTAAQKRAFREGGERREEPVEEEDAEDEEDEDYDIDDTSNVSSSEKSTSPHMPPSNETYSPTGPPQSGSTPPSLLSASLSKKLESLSLPPAHGSAPPTSPQSATSNGLASPSRFAPDTHQPRPRRLSARHRYDGQDGSWDDMHDQHARRASGSLIPTDREASASTPRPGARRRLPEEEEEEEEKEEEEEGGVNDGDEAVGGSVDTAGMEEPRAFAVWGQDESESEASDAGTS